MLSPRLGVVITAVIVAISSPSAVAGPAETVALQLKFGLGEVIYESTSATLKLTVKADSVRQEIPLQSQARRAIRTLNVDPDGTMLVEMALEDYRITTGGRPQEPIKPPAVFKVRPDGKIVERQIGAESIGVFPLPFPDRPVAVGDSWTRQTTFEEAGVIATGPITVTLRRVERVAGERIAHLQIRMVGTITGAAGVIKSAPGTTVKVSGTARVEGAIPYSVDRARPLGSAATVSMDIKVEVTAEGQSAAATVAVAGTTADKPIAPTQLKPPAISPEVLIIPGKSIGVVNLDQPVTEVTQRLGSPTQEAGIGGRTTLLSWPTRLQGYVEAGDATRFVGLAMSDRAYRTEKGIGFGSSQGAVMMTYGMTPTQLDLKVAAGGSVRMLIYNDQGIAFAITSDQAHADLTPTQAPVGAVDSIAIFRPGGAAKIFLIP